MLLPPAGTEASSECSGSPRSSAANSLRWGGRGGASAAPRRWSGWEPSSLGCKHWPGPLEGSRRVLSAMFNEILSSIQDFHRLALTRWSLSSRWSRDVHGGQDALKVTELDGLVGGGASNRGRDHRGLSCSCESRGRKLLKKHDARFSLNLHFWNVTRLLILFLKSIFVLLPIK